MKFTDICLITDDVLELRGFYERVFLCASEGDRIHSFISIAGLGLAIYDKKTAEEDMSYDFDECGRGLMTIGFNVDSVEEEYRRILGLGIEYISEPKEWPWGAKSFYFKDLDGNRIVMRSWPKVDKEDSE